MSMARRVFLLSLLILTASPSVVRTMDAKTSFPSGATASCFMPSGGFVFAGTSGGVYRSSDSGLTWAAASAGLTKQPGHCSCSNCHPPPRPAPMVGGSTAQRTTAEVGLLPTMGCQTFMSLHSQFMAAHCSQGPSAVFISPPIRCELGLRWSGCESESVRRNRKLSFRRDIRLGRLSLR